ncbi:MAG TPA: alpha-ketoglutarate-dependent dioxygenase AlkB [Steroidobacteraceae bacterium]|nr:alpha-ketoglutarate-dependent dioxygenase AlkB [Steroidobacteraceae bacterium]
MQQADLLDADRGLPAGLDYEPEFLSVQQEKELLEAIGSQPLQEAEYREWKAKRRIVSYGGRYDFTHRELGEAPPIPEFLYPLREQIARWAGIVPAHIHHAVIAEYRPGTQLGWHRDVPNFERVMGVSLGGRARMRLRPYPPRRGARAAVTLELEPRSAYSFSGPARWDWQHAISPTKELRYSITFRTLRNGTARA